MPTLSEALAIAFAHHQAGRLEAAGEIYRRVLAAEPRQPDAWHLWGMIALQSAQPALAIERVARAIEVVPTIAVYHRTLGDAYRAAGRLDEAAACYGRSLELEPGDPEACNKLGMTMRAQGKPAEAIGCYERALSLNADFPELHNNLGNAWRDRGQPAKAAECYRRALERNPDDPRFHSNLGAALRDLNELDGAARCCRRALELEPGSAEAYNRLGLVLQSQGKLAEAAACYRRAAQLVPGFVEAHNNLGDVLRRQGDLPGAIAECQQAIQLKPDHANAYNNLGNALKQSGRLDDAAGCYRRAIACKPDFAEAHSNLGGACKEQGRIAEAIESYRRAVEARPGFVHSSCNLIYTLHFSTEHGPADIADEIARFNRDQVEPLTRSIAPHANERAPERRLRIGYVSADFREHPVGRFLLPLLEAHDHGRFQIVCYSSVEKPDAITARTQSASDVWREALPLSDDQLAGLVRADQIDVLVDLTMHMAHSRLLAFARKPAPVQVTYLAYCGTTGLPGMDYRFTDPYLDPPGDERPYYSEQSVWLPETYWCYQAPADAPRVTELPAPGAGHVTFGCLNNFCKISAPTLDAWCRLLAAVPESRLMLHAYQGSHRDRLRSLVSDRGISLDRLAFVDLLPALDYFQTYQQIDVALDPFPYGGGTTTCDALWMGVPVVSLLGQQAPGRGGLSILSNLDLAELVAHDSDQYVGIAAGLARDLPRLASLRATLRDRMQRSPLMDAPRFARHVEDAYRTMWKRWCETG